MYQELDSLKRDIDKLVAEYGFAVFRGQQRGNDGVGEIFWNADDYSDPREFLEVAKKLEVKLIVVHDRTFSERMLDEAMEKLEASEMPRDETREFERALKRLRGYLGFVCSVQLSFDYQNNTYLFGADTEWYHQFVQVLDDLDEILETGPLGDDSGPLGGYLSNN
jgi:hypothetical protein